MKKQKRIGALVGIAVSVGLLLFLFHGIEWPKLLSALQTIRPLWILPMVGCFFFYYVIKAWRWKLLLPKSSNSAFWSRCHTTMIGSLGNVVLPLRAGEFIRPWALSKRNPVSFSAAFASVVTERVFDVIALLGSFAIFSTFIPNIPSIVLLGAQMLGAVALGIVVVMIVAYQAPDLVRSGARYLLSRILRNKPELVETVLHHLNEFIAGLRAIASVRELLLVILLSFLLWFEMGLSYWLALWAMDVPATFTMAMALNVIIALAVAAPSAPGFIGAFQAGCVATLHGIYGFPEEFALGYSIFTHAFQFIATVLFGVVSLRATGLQLRDAARSAEAEDEALHSA